LKKRIIEKRTKNTCSPGRKGRECGGGGGRKKERKQKSSGDHAILEESPSRTGVNQEKDCKEGKRNGTW